MKKVIYVVLTIAIVSLNIIGYFEVMNYQKHKYAHISICNSISLFQDIAEKKYEYLFENPLLSELKKLHERYGITVSIYTTDSVDDWLLEKCPSDYIYEFMSNSKWLKFGYHNSIDNAESFRLGRDAYKYTIHQLKRIVGENSIDVVPLLYNVSNDPNIFANIAWYNTQSGIKGMILREDQNASSFSDTLPVSMRYVVNNQTKDKETGLVFIDSSIMLDRYLIEEMHKKVRENRNNKAMELYFDSMPSIRDDFDCLENAVQDVNSFGFTWSFAQNELFRFVFVWQ